MTTFDDLLSGLLDRGGFRRVRIPEICLEALSQAALTTAAAIDRQENHSVILELNVPSYQSVSPDIEVRHRPFGLFFVGRRFVNGLILPVGFHSLSYTVSTCHFGKSLAFFVALKITGKICDIASLFMNIQTKKQRKAQLRSRGPAGGGPSKK